YRRVNLQQLIDDVPGLSGYAGQLGLISGAVDVVLDRGSGRIANPTAYVRRALSDDLYGVIASVPESSMRMGTPMGATSRPVVPAMGSEPEVFAAVPPQRLPVMDRQQDYLGLLSNEVSGLDHDLSVPSLEDLSSDNVPCTNMDHLLNYDMTPTRLANCNHCRIEQMQA